MGAKLQSSRPASVLALLVLAVAPSGTLAYVSPGTGNESTGQVSGTVVDEHGNPMQQTPVIAAGRRISAFTDSVGRFMLPGVPTGPCTIKAAKSSWGRGEATVEVAAGKTTVVNLVLKWSAGAPAPTFTGTEVPCDNPGQGAPELESLVQIGVGSDVREGIRTYVYKVLNRSPDTLTEVRIGFDARRGVCELTGVPPHAVPDTASGPLGWVCTPVQAKDPTKFALSCQMAPGWTGGGLPPNSYSPPFTVTLGQRDSLYEHCHWLVRGERRGEDGRLQPAREVDTVSMATGAITGFVTDLEGRPISVGLVDLWQIGLPAITDSDGSYLISNIPVGTYRLGARALDYEACAKGHVRVAAGDTTRVDFRLSTGSLSIPCGAYAMASERIDVPFPQGAVDSRGASFLDRGEPIPLKSPREAPNPQPYIYGLTARDVELVYRGLDQDTTRRAFVAKVNREFRNPTEERLLRIAEETYPPTKAVLLVTDQRSDRKTLSMEKRLWWYGDFDGVRLPYAVTMDAVRYYLGLVQAMGRGEPTESNGIRMKACNFSYSAHVSPGPTSIARDGREFQGVYVVDLKLEWMNYCGTTCACMFHLDRTVVLRADGTVLCVFGDRRPMVVVS
jgi:hypothetical protein